MRFCEHVAFSPKALCRALAGGFFKKLLSADERYLDVAVDGSGLP